MDARTARAQMILGIAAVVAALFGLTRRVQVGASVSSSNVATRTADVLFVHDRKVRQQGDRIVSMDIFVMRGDGSGRRRLTNTPGDEFDPVWSPDYRQIAFTALIHPRERKTDVYVMNADGSHRRQLTHNDPGTIVGAPCWSP